MGLGKQNTSLCVFLSLELLVKGKAVKLIFLWIHSRKFYKTDALKQNRNNFLRRLQFFFRYFMRMLSICQEKITEEKRKQSIAQRLHDSWLICETKDFHLSPHSVEKQCEASDHLLPIKENISSWCNMKSPEDRMQRWEQLGSYVPAD